MHRHATHSGQLLEDDLGDPLELVLGEGGLDLDLLHQPAGAGHQHEAVLRLSGGQPDL